jgi:thiosulfate/3-mercaptopyruvate sulfurtransferase
VSEIEYDELAERLGEVTVIDVRTDLEFSGEGGYPCCGRHGHIPGARHVPVEEILDAGDVQALIGEPDGAEVVVYCHSGGRSARAAAALREAGYKARNYGGSWHEWSRSPLAGTGSGPAEPGPAGA